MVMVTSKALNLSEESVVGCAIIYNSGRWNNEFDRSDLDYEYNKYLGGFVDTMLEDFCLDVLSGRLPRNKLVTAINKLNGKKVKK
jgi:hypothetical protein